MANTINKKKQETSRNSISHGKSNGFTRTNTFGQGPLENINIDFDTFSRLEVISGFFFQQSKLWANAHQEEAFKETYGTPIP